MVTEGNILRGMIDDHHLPAVAYLVADRRGEFEFRAGLEPEIDFVPHRARCPTRVRDPRHRRKAQAGHPTNHIQNRRYGLDARDRPNVVSYGWFHGFSKRGLYESLSYRSAAYRSRRHSSDRPERRL
jgi:hypothetical protein